LQRKEEREEEVMPTRQHMMDEEARKKKAKAEGEAGKPSLAKAPEQPKAPETVPPQEAGEATDGDSA